MTAYQILTAASATVWDPFMMVLLIGTGIFLTFRLRGIQVRKLVYTLPGSDLLDVADSHCRDGDKVR